MQRRLGPVKGVHVVAQAGGIEQRIGADRAEGEEVHLDRGRLDGDEGSDVQAHRG